MPRVSHLRLTCESLNSGGGDVGTNSKHLPPPAQLKGMTNFIGGVSRQQPQQRVTRNSFYADINIVPPCEKAHCMEPGWH